MKTYIKNGLKILVMSALLYAASCTSNTTNSHEEEQQKEYKREGVVEMEIYFKDKSAEHRKSFYNATQVRDSLQLELSKYKKAKKSGPNNQGLYVVNLDEENNYEAKLYTKEGLEKVINKTSEELNYRIGSGWRISEDSTEYLKYEMIANEISDWINDRN